MLGRNQTSSATFRLTAFNVGHGDAILLEARDPDRRWTALVDGGQNPSHLIECLRQKGIDQLDLVVATHLDTDHIQGLSTVAENLRVGEYWGPAIPAFERHAWVFGSRCADALHRGKQVESEMRRSGASVVYPLEGFGTQPFNDHTLRIGVLSPPRRLVRTLIYDDDITRLLSSATTPLGWLLGPEQELEEDRNSDYAALDSALRTGALTRKTIPAPRQRRRQRRPRPDRLMQEWAEQHDSEPEFFGDPLFNNTSIVLWIDVMTGTKRHRLLLPGDLENWVYLFASHSTGLQADIVKATHHGGRIYLENEEAHEEFMDFVRPQAVIISANGRFGLPRARVRSAAVRWGAAVLCTKSRGLEHLSGPGPETSCCFDGFGCHGESHIALTLDEHGIVVDRAACHSASSDRGGPIVQIQRHIIEPSPILQQLFEGELRRYLRWTKRELVRIHKERMALPSSALESQPVPIDWLTSLARRDGMEAAVPHMEAILSEGRSRGQFWSKPGKRSHEPTAAYRRLTKTQIKNYLRDLRKKAVLLFPGAPDPELTDRTSFLLSLEVAGLASHAQWSSRLPQEAFLEVLWPSVLTFLSDECHCFKHECGLVGISRIKDAKKMFKELLDFFQTGRLYSKNKQVKVPFSLTTEKEISAAPIIVSSKRRDMGSWEAGLKKWLTVSRTALSMEGWSWGFENEQCEWKSGEAVIRMDRGRDEGSLPIHSYEADSKDDIERIAKALSSCVARVW